MCEVMGHKLDVSNLTEDEAEHVLQVVQRDMQLRKTEEDRLSELKQELDQEESRCVLLSRHRGFNERCCIRCCSSFTFLVKPRRRCQDCHYNVCRRCCSYSETDKSWLCSACEKSRLLKTQSLEWFYSNVRRRFKRFGSAKVLKLLYRRHVGEQGSQAEFTEESLYDESLGTEDSMYENDSTFYKHCEEWSMAETISVALRVAKEAIDEAIAKAERQRDNQAKQKEGCYLRDNRGELTKKLTTMIVETIICRTRDLSEMQADCSLESAPDQNSNKSLLTVEMLAQHDKTESSSVLCSEGQKKDGVPNSTLPSGSKNVDWLDNSWSSSVLQSPDWNWFALQSTQLSRLSLPNKRENLMFSALDKESCVISAYDGIVSDAESDISEDWTAAWLEVHQNISSSNMLNDCQTTSPESTMSPLTQITKDQSHDISMTKMYNQSLPFLKRKVSQHLSAQCLGFNINTDVLECNEDGLEDGYLKRSRRMKISKRENAEAKSLREFMGQKLSLSEPDYGRILLDVLLKCQNKKQGALGFLGDQMSTDMPDSLTPDILKSGTITPDELTNEELTSTLRDLANQNAEILPTKNDHDRLVVSMDERNEDRDKTKKDREREGRECLWDMDINVYQSDSSEIKMELNNAQMVNQENLNCFSKDVVESETCSCKKDNLELCSSENLSADTITTLREYEIKIATELEEHEMHVVDSTANIQLEGQIKIYIDKTSNENEGSSTIEKDDRLEHREGPGTQTKSEQNTLKKPDEQSMYKVNEQRQTEVRNVETGQIDSQRCEEQGQDTHNVKNKTKDETEKVHSSTREEKQIRDTNDQHDFRKKEDYERKIDKALDNMEEQIEAHMSSNIRFAKSVATHTWSEATEQMQEQDCLEYIQTKDHSERDELLHGKNWLHALNEKKEEQGCEEQENCDGILFKDVLHSTLSGQEGYLSPEEIYKAVSLDLEKDMQVISTLLEQKYSAASLRNITTEVLKVLNATEDLIQGSMDQNQPEPQERPVLSPSQSKKIEEQLSRLEENVYVAASGVFELEGELGELEQCARSINGEMKEEELTHLEEQVASAAAQVQQSDLQVSDIAVRIAALKSAGLNVAPQTRFAKLQTIGTTRQHRRKLPAPPMQGKKV